jgi:hypothetical protein
VASASDSQPARHRLRIEMWSWSAWLVLAIISYPAVVLIYLAPRSGLLAGLIVGLLIAYAASLGYAARHDLERWLVPTLMSLVGACAVAAISLLADRAPVSTAALCGLVFLAETVFVWHFLPWLVRDADSVDPPSSISVPLPGRRRSDQAPVRASLGLVLLLAFLVLGLGAVWSRGEAKVPNPTVWIIVLGAFTLSLMFVERLGFLERSAREGNLLMVAGSYRKWLAAALIFLIVLGGMAAIAPVRHARERESDSRGGTAAIETPSPPATVTSSAPAAVAAAVSAAAAGVRSAPRSALPLLLLLLLILLALALIWGFRKSRAAQKLLRAAAWLLALCVRAWNRLRAWFLRLRTEPGVAASAAGDPVDPLVDPFESIEDLEGLTAREIVVRTYHRVLDFAEMLGQGRRRGQTPFEYARALAGAAPDASESVAALTWAYSGAMYGGADAPIPDPGSVRDFWRRITSALAAPYGEEELQLRRRAYLAARQVERSNRRLPPAP